MKNHLQLSRKVTLCAIYISNGSDTMLSDVISHKYISLFAFAVVAAVIATGSTGCLLSSNSSKPLGDGHDFGDNSPDVVVALGDSITAGSSNPGGTPWPARLSNILAKTVVNDGIPGATSSIGEARVQSLINQHRPGFVIVFYGANDAIHGNPVAATSANLRSMVVTAKNNQCIPLIATVMPMSGGRNIYNGRVDRINDEIRKIASEEGAKLVNIHRAVNRDPDLYLIDGLHPNDLGEELIALEFMDAFK